MKTVRYLILVGISVALLNLSNTLHNNSEPSSVFNGAYNVGDLSDNAKNRYSEEGRYADPYRTINNLNESQLPHAINSFLDESNSEKVLSDDESYQNAAASSSGVLSETSENLSSAYAKLIELSRAGSAKSYDKINDKQKIKGPTQKKKTQEKSHIRIKSAKNLNNRESINIKNFHTQHIKKKDVNFLEKSKQDLLNSDLTGTNYVMENAFENAFDDVDTDAKENMFEVVGISDAESGKSVGKNVKKSKKRKYEKQTAFVENNKKKHRDSSHGKKEKKKHIHRANSSESYDNSKHKNAVHKKHTKNKKEGHINKSDQLEKVDSHLQTASESEDIEEDNDEEHELRNAEETEQDTTSKSSGKHSPKNDNDITRKLLHTGKHERAHSSTNEDNNDDNNDDDDDDDNNGDDDDTNNDDKNDHDEEGNENLMLKHEIDDIKKYSKVYKLNLFNCSFINDWDFAHQYVEERGSLVKLSGYIFQNMQDTDAMPTTNTSDWKLKGACDFKKYVCGALNFMPNQYNKGDRVIFENKLYEALMNTELSPQDDGSSWVDKTTDCEEKLIGN